LTCGVNRAKRHDAGFMAVMTCHSNLQVDFITLHSVLSPEVDPCVYLKLYQRHPGQVSDQYLEHTHLRLMSVEASSCTQML